MEASTQKRLILFNCFFLILILLDYSLPGRISPIVELNSFYSFRAKIQGGNKPSYVDRKILSLNNGETFRIIKIPEGNFQKGQKIQIVKSAFTENIKEIIILGARTERKSVGVFSNNLMFYLFVISIVISLCSLFQNHKILNILLIASSMFLFVFGIGYLLT